MKLRTLVLSVVVLAILSGVVYVAQRPGPPPSRDPRVGQPIVDRSTVEKAAKLTVSDGGKTITLTRQSDGSWRDESYFDLPADFTKLSGFVGNLTDAKIDRFVTANPERLSRLEFKDTKIEMVDRAGKSLWSVTLGKNAETGGGRFLRYDDEKKAYLASLNAWIDNDPKNWANAELLNLKSDDIAKVEINFPAVAASTTEPKTPASPATSVVLSRGKKDSPWTSAQTPANDRVKADKVTSLLSDVASIRFSDTSDPKDANVAAAKEHERVVKLTTFDGKTYTVAMGRKPEEKKLKPATEKPAESAPAKEPGKKEPAKEPAKPAVPEYETIPAGPSYVFISSSDTAAPINGLMQKRAYQISEYVFTALPQKPNELFEAAPPPPAPEAEAKKAEPFQTGSAAAGEKSPSTPTAHPAKSADLPEASTTAPHPESAKTGTAPHPTGQ